MARPWRPLRRPALRRRTSIRRRRRRLPVPPAGASGTARTRCTPARRRRNPTSPSVAMRAMRSAAPDAGAARTGSTAASRITVRRDSRAAARAAARPGASRARAERRCDQPCDRSRARRRITSASSRPSAPRRRRIVAGAASDRRESLAQIKRDRRMVRFADLEKTLLGADADGVVEQPTQQLRRQAAPARRRRNRQIQELRFARRHHQHAVRDDRAVELRRPACCNRRRGRRGNCLRSTGAGVRRLLERRDRRKSASRIGLQMHRGASMPAATPIAHRARVQRRARRWSARPCGARKSVPHRAGNTCAGGESRQRERADRRAVGEQRRLASKRVPAGSARAAPDRRRIRCRRRSSRRLRAGSRGRARSTAGATDFTPPSPSRS